MFYCHAFSFVSNNAVPMRDDTVEYTSRIVTTLLVYHKLSKKSILTQVVFAKIFCENEALKKHFLPHNLSI